MPEHGRSAPKGHAGSTPGSLCPWHLSARLSPCHCTCLSPACVPLHFGALSPTSTSPFSFQTPFLFPTPHDGVSP